jgi:hypothetical protein
VVEGVAAIVRDEARLRGVAEAFAANGWPVEIRDGVFWADGARTAGPPPYDVYDLTLTTAFGFGLDESVAPTRWRFPPEATV